MDMSMMSMGMHMPVLADWPKFYWAVVGTAVGIAALLNIYNFALYRQRLSAARRGSPSPAKPKSWFALWHATLFALTREATNFSIRVPLKNRILRVPTVGRTSLILANVVVLVVLCLYGLDLTDQFDRENVGFRCGVVTIGQIPLIILLSSKNNIIGCLSGVSYERINWLHRWCARCMLLTATMHMGYFFSAWAPYDYIGYQLKNNGIVWRGLGAWCVLVWIVFSSMTPIRGWCYEIFVLQHIVSFAVFLAFVYIHTPAKVHAYIWIPVAVFLFDRVLRALRMLYINTSIFHPKQRKQGQTNSLWTCKAEFTPLSHNTTRIVIHNPPITWTPGQHVYLSCHSVAPLQSHPFTIASIPEDGKMEFYVKAEKGGTKRFFRYAEKTTTLAATSRKTRTVAIEGPYGCLRPLRQFDSVVFFAGSTGSTFTVPLLRDLIQGWKENADPIASKPRLFFQHPTGAVTRHVRFIWVVKSRGQLSWFSKQLSSIYADFSSLQQTQRNIKLEISIYITCDESFTEEQKSLLSAPQKDSSHGKVQYRARPASTSEQKGIQPEKEDVREVKSLDSSNSNTRNVPCCCRRTTTNEETPFTTNTCHCSSKARPTSNTSTSTTSSSSLEPALHPSISSFTGRPATRDMIRRSLEQALGESAVVVCGPQGLVADIKYDVVALSDERAVHKGTGAQGIYLHTESFGW